MWHKPCRTFHPWCPCIKTHCLLWPCDDNLSCGLHCAMCPDSKNQCSHVINVTLSTIFHWNYDINSSSMPFKETPLKMFSFIARCVDSPDWRIQYRPSMAPYTLGQSEIIQIYHWHPDAWKHQFPSRVSFQMHFLFYQFAWICTLIRELHVPKTPWFRSQPGAEMATKHRLMNNCNLPYWCMSLAYTSLDKHNMPLPTRNVYSDVQNWAVSPSFD